MRPARQRPAGSCLAVNPCGTQTLLCNQGVYVSSQVLVAAQLDRGSFACRGPLDDHTCMILAAQSRHNKSWALHTSAPGPLMPCTAPNLPFLQVLRTNLKSLKHTVQQLLTDVSTLMQHTATTRQQQQQQQELQQQQEQASQQLGAGQWQRQASSSQWKLQQAAHGTVPASAEPGAGSNSNSHCLAGTATRRGANGGRRCVSADGSAPSSATGGGGGRESSSSIVALTMQRLIGSIERMSRHFADCHAGKLIEDYSSTGPAGVAPAAAAAVTAGSQHGSNSRLAENHDGSAVNALGGNSNSCSAAEGCVRGINSDGRPVSSEVTTGLDVTANVGRNSSSNSSSSTGGRHQQPHSSRVRQQQVPRPPSSGSGSSGSGRLRAPGPPVLGGVAAAAAAISTAMANASAPRALSTRPGALNNRPAGLCSNSSLHGSAAATNSSADLHQQQGPLEKPAVDRAEADDGMRHSFDRGQAKAAADAWFAATAHGLGSSLGSRGPAVPGAVAAAASGSGRGELSADQLQQTSRQGSFADSNTPATAGAPCSSSSMKEIAATAAGSGVLGASRGVVAEASDSSSTSSLGPSISEVWQQSSEPHRKNVVAEAEAPAAAAAAVHTVDPVASATAHNKQHQNLQQQQQQWHQEETRPHGRLQDGHSSAKLSGRPQSAAPAAAPATAYAKPPAKGKGRPGASGPGSSLVRKAATRPPGPHAPASMLPSGPLTAGLHSSAARRRVHSTSYSSTGSRDSIATAFSSGCGSPGQPSGASLGSDSSGWGAAGSSRSNSSCSYRSGHSSSSCASLVPQQQQGRPQNTAGGGRVGGRAAGVSASSSSLGCDAVLIGSAGNSPASTNAATPPAQTPATSAGGVPQAAATGYSGSTGPWSPAAAGGRGSSDSYPAHLSPARGGAASGNGCASQHGLTAAAGNPKAVRSLDWSHGGTAVQLAGGVMQQGRPAAGDAPPQHPTGIQQGQQQSSQVPGLPSHNPGGATPGTLQQQAQPQQHQHHLVPVLPCAVTKQQQLQPQPVLPASVGRAQVGLLSPILEEVLGGSCTTTPRTSTSDTGDVAFVGRGALSEGGYRSSKLRSSSCPNAAPGPAQAAAQNGVQAIAGAGNGPVQQHQQTYSSAAGGGDDAVPDACPQQEGGRADSPKAVRSGSVSPPDTAAGKDTSPACKQGKHQDKQHYSVQQQSHEELVQELPCGAAGAAVEGHSATGHCPKQSSATTSLLSEAAAVPSPVGSAGRAGRPAQFRRRSWEGDTSSSHQLLTAFPLDLGPCSHSLDSLDTLLMDTSCCHSEEDHCADLRVSTDGLVTGRKDGMAAYPAGEEDAEGAVGQRSGGRVSAGLDLQDLLAIVLDVMNDKQAADKRCVVSAA